MSIRRARAAVVTPAGGALHTVEVFLRSGEPKYPRSRVRKKSVIALIQAVKRNSARFPDDFMFQLSSREFTDLRSQIVISSLWGGRRTAPYAFTEQGVAMLSTVLRSRRAIAVNIEIMRAFVRLRRMMAEYEHLGRRIDELEKRTDGQFEVVFDAIRALINAKANPKRRIGYLSAAKPPAG